MGKQEIRYAAKVSLDTPPPEQKVLHVSCNTPILYSDAKLL